MHKYMDSVFRKNRWIFLCWLGVCAVLFLVLSLRFQNLTAIRLWYSIAMGTTLVVCAYVMWKQSQRQRRMMLVLMGLVLLGMLPFLLNGFCYGDDYWAYHNPSGMLPEVAVGLQRPLEVTSGIFSGLSLEQLNIARMVNVCVLSVLAGFLFCYIQCSGRGAAFAVCFVLLCTCSVIAADCIGYLSVSIVIYATLCSCAAYAMFAHAYDEKKPLYYVVFAFLLLSAFCMYQIATPVVFVLFVAQMEKNSKEKERFKKAFLLLVLYGVIAVAYLIASRLVQQFYGITASQSARAQFVTPLQLIQKLMWFAARVVPQAAQKICAALLGMRMYTPLHHFYTIRCMIPWLGWVLLLVCAALIVTYLVSLLRQKRFLSVFIHLCAYPLCYYPFLILPENTILTYYQFVLIALVVYHMLCGLKIIAGWIQNKVFCASKHLPCIRRATLGLLAVLVTGNTILYANMWSMYSRDSYQYLLQSIASQMTEQTQTICVVGRISEQVGYNPYGTFAVEHALEKLGENPQEYQIIQTDNAYYVYALESEQLEKLTQMLTQEEYDALMSYYEYDVTYARYVFDQTRQNDQKELEFIRDCLQKAELLYVQTTQDCIVIEMDGFLQTHVF